MVCADVCVSQHPSKRIAAITKAEVQPHVGIKNKNVLKYKSW